MKLQTSGKEKNTFFLFGRVTMDLTCGATTCSHSCFVGVNGNHVSGTLVGISGKAFEQVRDEHSVFAAVTVNPTTTTSSTAAQPPLQWWCRFTNQRTSSTGTTVGAIRLGG